MASAKGLSASQKQSLNALSLDAGTGTMASVAVRSPLKQSPSLDGVSTSAGSDAPEPCRALVVRHGETDFNADGRIQGVLESQLTDQGRAQARVVGSWLSEALAGGDTAIDRVLVSPKDRTMQTLDEITEELGGALPVAVEQRFGLREVELTPWQGMTKPEIKAQDGEAWEAWKVSPCDFVFSTGHAPLQDLYARAGAEWAHLRDTALPGTTSLVVAHGAFNRVFLAQALGLPIEAFQDDSFDFGNCETVEFEWTEHERSFRWRRRHPTLSGWKTLDEEQTRFAALLERGLESKQYEVKDPGSSKGA